MEHADGNGAVHTERGHTSWRETLPVLTKVVHVTTSQGLTECWPYVKERLNIIKKKDKSSGHWLPEHIRHMVQEGFLNPAIRYPVELHLALDDNVAIHGFIVGYTKLDPYINLPLTYHIWVGWGSREGIARFIPWLEAMCKERGLTAVEFESGRFGWMTALSKMPKSGFYLKQTIYRKDIV